MIRCNYTYTYHSLPMNIAELPVSIILINIIVEISHVWYCYIGINWIIFQCHYGFACARACSKAVSLDANHTMIPVENFVGVSLEIFLNLSKSDTELYFQKRYHKLKNSCLGRRYQMNSFQNIYSWTVLISSVNNFCCCCFFWVFLLLLFAQWYGSMIACYLIDF